MRHEHVVLARRKALRRVLGVDQRQAEELVALRNAAIDDERRDLVRAVVGEVVVREPGDVAGAEDHELGHAASSVAR